MDLDSRAMDDVEGIGVGGPDQDVPADDPFEVMMERAIAAIPGPFRDQLGSVAIVVEDWPSSEQLESAGADGLYGLYQGVPRTAFGAELAQVASKITIFRGPLEQRFRDPASLRAAVEDTLRHEVAHHLGISDARLGELRHEIGR
jgi:predicted Zn-dependent protease with MMP-like domain